MAVLPLRKLVLETMVEDKVVVSYLEQHLWVVDKSVFQELRVIVKEVVWSRVVVEVSCRSRVDEWEMVHSAKFVQMVGNKEIW